MYELLAKYEVKMAGYICQGLFFRGGVFMHQEGVEVHKLIKKTGQYSAILTKQAWSTKDLLYGFWGNFS